MGPQDTCKDRNVAPCCHKTCEQLKRQKEYPLTAKAAMNFILPLVIFIVGFAIFKAILAEIFDTEQLQTALSFLISLALTIAAVVLIRKNNKPTNRTK